MNVCVQRTVDTNIRHFLSTGRIQLWRSRWATRSSLSCCANAGGVGWAFAVVNSRDDSLDKADLCIQTVDVARRCNDYAQCSLVRSGAEEHVALTQLAEMQKTGLRYRRSMGGKYWQPDLARYGTCGPGRLAKTVRDGYTEAGQWLFAACISISRSCAHLRNCYFNNCLIVETDGTDINALWFADLWLWREMFLRCTALSTKE